MKVHLLKSKIHRAQITDSCIDYEGSLTISADLVEKVGFHAYEKILCSNMANGARFETYIILGKPGTGEIILNGAAARMGKVGDRLTIMGFTFVDEKLAANWTPRVIVLGEGNVIEKEKGLVENQALARHALCPDS
jgi:aspartate 1-decarboxylase